MDPQPRIPRRAADFDGLLAPVPEGGVDDALSATGPSVEARSRSNHEASSAFAPFTSAEVTKLSLALFELFSRTHEWGRVVSVLDEFVAESLAAAKEAVRTGEILSAQWHNDLGVRVRETVAACVDYARGLPPYFMRPEDPLVAVTATPVPSAHAGSAMRRRAESLHGRSVGGGIAGSDSPLAGPPPAGPPGSSAGRRRTATVMGLESLGDGPGAGASALRRSATAHGPVAELAAELLPEHAVPRRVRRSLLHVVAPRMPDAHVRERLRHLARMSPPAAPGPVRGPSPTSAAPVTLLGAGSDFGEHAAPLSDTLHAQPLPRPLRLDREPAVSVSARHVGLREERGSVCSAASDSTAAAVGVTPPHPCGSSRCVRIELTPGTRSSRASSLAGDVVAGGGRGHEGGGDCFCEEGGGGPQPAAAPAPAASAPAATSERTPPRPPLRSLALDRRRASLLPRAARPSSAAAVVPLDIPSDAFDVLASQLERRVMRALHGATHAVCADDRLEDEVTGTRLRRLQWLSPADLHVPPGVGALVLRLATHELRCMSAAAVPEDALASLVAACSVLARALALEMRRAAAGASPAGVVGGSSGSAGTSAAGADEFLPAVIYAVLQANPPHLASTLAYLERFRDPSQLMGQAGFCFTALRSAVCYLRDLGPGDIPRVPSALFESRCAAAAAGRIASWLEAQPAVRSASVASAD